MSGIFWCSSSDGLTSSYCFQCAVWHVCFMMKTAFRVLSLRCWGSNCTWMLGLAFTFIQFDFDVCCHQAVVIPTSALRLTLTSSRERLHIPTNGQSVPFPSIWRVPDRHVDITGYSWHRTPPVFHHCCFWPQLYYFPWHVYITFCHFLPWHWGSPWWQGGCAIGPSCLCLRTI